MIDGELLSALADGELSPAEESEVLAHLAGCADCAAELADLQRVRRAVRDLPWLDPPAVLVGESSAGARDSPTRTRGAAAAGAVLAAAAAMLFAVATPDPRPVRPRVAQLVDVHATSGPGTDPVSVLTPAAVPVRFGE
ncbi:MAG TPA: zf-HC2 domain-containing protein [Acidimicrobiales bacterium]|nr:zf-HC2 domain-containing protein [Acidimicrobiales bacterium]